LGHSVDFAMSGPRPKAANSLGLTLSPQLLLRAHEVIE